MAPTEQGRSHHSNTRRVHLWYQLGGRKRYGVIADITRNSATIGAFLGPASCFEENDIGTALRQTVASSFSPHGNKGVWTFHITY